MAFRVAFGKFSFVWVKIHTKPYQKCLDKSFQGSPYLKIHGWTGMFVKRLRCNNFSLIWAIFSLVKRNIEKEGVVCEGKDKYTWCKYHIFEILMLCRFDFKNLKMVLINRKNEKNQ